ncbi:hypothetical protein MIMGU_mgv11b024198mg [Erythranthe guttata]|uniref:Homeobox domain-containing protein n=1 Tax=Erythranthe guttata TaxID=4155 RepID=A0A022RQT8_ERYGU|nr:hypothetical protein MIMGU_mgv11b024198mg [Erythranthe guttata]
MNSNVSEGDDASSFVNDENDNISICENSETQPQNRKRHHRHSAHQIQRMEELFTDSPHLDKKQRRELSEELGMEELQIKFWFQNKRTQMKGKYEHKQNTYLRAENEKLREENLKLGESLSNACCLACGKMIDLGDLCQGERRLRMENARLIEEIDRITTLAAKYIGRSL